MLVLASFAPQVMAQPLAAHAGTDVSACGGAATTLGATPNTATGGQGPYQYSWSPAAGLSSTTAQHPVCTTNTTQTYTLTVTDANNNTATDQVTVTVLPTPTAVLTVAAPAVESTFNGLTTFSLCDPALSWNFAISDNGSSAQAGATWHIDWGDASAAYTPAGAGWSTNHTYNQGLHTITYTITNPGAGGCVRTVQYQVFLGTNPGGGISTDPNTNICTGGSLPFYLNNVSSNSPGTTYLIDFGDGNTVLLNHPPPAVINHQYDVSSCPGGSFTVSFTAQNPCDHTDGQISPIRVSQTPVVDFTISPNDTACVNSTVTFTDGSVGAQAPQCSAPRHIWSIAPATYTIASGSLGNTNGNPNNPGLWTGGSGSLGVQFTSPGTYTITDVTGNVCGFDTLTRSICVEAPPQPSFTLSPATGCTPLVSTVDNTSTSPNSCRTTYQWLATFNSAFCSGTGTVTYTGGTTPTSFEPQFTFTGAGSYAITLQAINSCGSFPVAQPVTVGAPPQVAVNPLPGLCAGQSLSPSATFTACGSPITGYTWSMTGGTPNSANTQSPGSVSYPTAGNYTVIATAQSACGNTSASQPVVVTNLPPAPTVGGPITVCAGQTLTLSAGNIPNATFHWTGPNGFESFTQSLVINNVTAAAQGTYTVTASGGGCSGPPSTINVTVTPSPVVTITPSNPGVCVGTSVTLNASGAGNYQWSTSGGATGTGPSFTFTPASTGTVTLLGDQGGCPGTTSTIVTVYQLPTVNAGPDETYCESSTPATLIPITPGGTWSGSPNVTAGGQFTPSPQGIYTLTYTVTSPQGCVNSDQITAVVGPPPVLANAGPDTTVCRNSGPLQLSGTPNGGTWSGSVSSGGVFTPSTAGNFTLTYSSGVGTCASTDDVTVTVVNAATVVAGNDISACVDGAAVTLNGSPAGGTWTGPGLTGSTFTPATAGVGAHTLTYTFTDPNGCTVSDQLTATVDPLPVVDAGGDVTFCDQPFAQQLTGFSPAGGTWSGSPNVTAGGSFTPSGTGTFNLTYTYTSGAGCTASDGLVVTVVPITNPASAGNDTAVCINSGTLQLNGAPGGGTWSGPHVSASGAFDPAVSGTFTLTYSVGTASCVTQDQVDITVHPLPVVTITSSTSICLDGGPQTVTATPVGGTWSGTGITDAVNGTFDPAVSGAGTFPITYAVTDANGCSNSTSADAVVNPLPVAGFTNAAIACVNAPFPFTDGSSGATQWDWDFGDNTTGSGASPSHTYTATGTYTVTQTVSTGAGCVNSTTGTVTVWEGPTVDFTATPTDGCAPLAVGITNNSSGNGVTYQWDLGDGTTSSLDQPGTNVYTGSAYVDTTYTITLTATNVCTSVSASQDVVVHPVPSAYFGPDFDYGCSPWPVTFSNVTIGQADSFQWDFGDGSTSNTLDSLVHHTYYTGANDTTYTITLIATNSCGTDTAHYTVLVQPNTITAFFNTDTTSGCAPLTVNFTQYSIGVTHWHWEFGDGNVSMDHDVSNTYTDPGTYTATLFGDNGCSYDTVRVTITVLPSPDVSFSVVPDSVCAGVPFQFVNGTADIASIAWDFGDGNTSTLTDPTHTYASTGDYPVSLTVISSLNDCPATLTRTVNVKVTPVASLTPSPVSGCVPLTVLFNNGSTNAGYYEWDFGDGNTGGELAPEHVYADAGTYDVRLIAENVNGCRDTAYTEVVGFPLPVADFTFSPTESCTSPVDIQFTDASSGAITHAWSFSNGVQSPLNDPVVTFQSAGTWYATETVTNSYGCSDSHSDSLIVHPTPVAAFTAEPQPGCAGYPIVFNNESLNSTWWHWSFGDGGTSTDSLPWHVYDAGVYDLTLVVQGAGGCRDTLESPGAIVVNPTPVADFAYDTLRSVSYALQFHNLSEGANAWVWDFGDHSTSNEYEPLHLFPAGPNDWYPLCLIAINSYGCPDTLCRTVRAPADPNIYAPNAFTPDLDGLNETWIPILNGFDGWRYHLYILDRWGEVIWDTADRYKAWDGNARGKVCKTEVYVWKVVLNIEGDERVYYGHVTLVRGSE